MVYTTLCYLEKDNKYLMLLRNKKEVDENKGKWIGVGGHVEDGENPVECIIRETHEETGLILNSVKPRAIIDFTSNTWESQRGFIFTSDDFSGEMISNCDEGELKWVEKSEVMDLNIWEGDRLFLPALLNDEPFFFMELNYIDDILVSHNFGPRNFDEEIYTQVARIPKGKVASYGEIAVLSGHMGAARACGSALHRNPYEGVIPCHRVVNSKGKLADDFVFGGPGEQKRRLMEEGVRFKDDGTVLMED